MNYSQAIGILHELQMFGAKPGLERAQKLAAALGDPVPAARLYALGLIARCLPEDLLEAEATKIINRLAANAPLSLKAMKALTVRQLEFRDGIPHEDVDALVRTAISSQDAREGILARLEKRQARFQGV